MVISTKSVTNSDLQVPAQTNGSTDMYVESCTGIIKLMNDDK